MKLFLQMAILFIIISAIHVKADIATTGMSKIICDKKGENLELEIDVTAKSDS